jgi:hypothetical protein
MSYRVALRAALSELEQCAGKLASTVLRGAGCSNVTSLLGRVRPACIGVLLIVIVKGRNVKVNNLL